MQFKNTHIKSTSKYKGKLFILGHIPFDDAMITKDGKRVPNDFVSQLQEVIHEAGRWVDFMKILRKTIGIHKTSDRYCL